MEPVWLEISIETTAAGLDGLAAKLTYNGVPGLVIEDEADFLRFLEENRPYWDYVDDALFDRMRGVSRVKFYVTDDADGKEQCARYLAGLEHLPVSSARLREDDWAHSWKKYYRPMPVGKALYIVPEWERGTAIPPEKVPIYLNPGLIFGTGSHASTQLCLEAAEAYVRPGARILDLGCGSGILSIAALCLGAAWAEGVDIDPKAAGVALENAAFNGIGADRFSACAGDVLSDDALRARLAKERFHLVLANIVADVIIPLSAFVPALLAGGGVFLCSGIIGPRAEEVRRALARNGLFITAEKEKDGWVAFAAQAVR